MNPFLRLTAQRSALNRAKWELADESARFLAISPRAVHWLEERYSDAAELKKLARIAAQFPPALRHPELSLDHFHVLLRVPKAQRIRWIHRTARKGWSPHHLARAIRRAQADPNYLRSHKPQPTLLAWLTRGEPFLQDLSSGRLQLTEVERGIIAKTAQRIYAACITAADEHGSDHHHE